MPTMGKNFALILPSWMVILIVLTGGANGQEVRELELQDHPRKSHQELVAEYMKKPYTGSTLDALNGARSPDEYKVRENDNKERRLKKQIVNAIYMEIETKKIRVEEGQDQVSSLLGACRKLHKAREAVHDNDTESLIKVARDMIKLAKDIEVNRRMRLDAGVGRPDAWAEAFAYRLECELRLLQLDPSAE